MAYRFSKEELDEQFEEFLKEVCLRARSHLKKEKKKKDSVPWWLSEEDLDDGGPMNCIRMDLIPFLSLLHQLPLVILDV
uniref:Uncharacterized protein n=1 Tax=Cyanistes caeruleus TaxID=156563 RepID=A0A8C0ZGI1_CYACU